MTKDVWDRSGTSNILSDSFNWIISYLTCDVSLLLFHFFPKQHSHSLFLAKIIELKETYDRIINDTWQLTNLPPVGLNKEVSCLFLFRLAICISKLEIAPSLHISQFSGPINLNLWRTRGLTRETLRVLEPSLRFLSPFSLGYFTRVRP